MQFDGLVELAYVFVNANILTAAPSDNDPLL